MATDVSERSLPARARRWSAARRGRLLRRAREWFLDWEDRRFERELNVATGGPVLEPADATIADGEAAHGSIFVPEPIRVADSWMEAVTGVVQDYTFIDLGSGKGRLLFRAAQRGYGRVIGVEFARELHDAAVENKTASTLRAKDRIELVLGDAGAFNFPGEPLAIHFNNPFNERVMSRVLENLTRAYKQSPRPLTITYQHHRYEPPEHRYGNVEMLAATPFLERMPLPYRSFLERRWLLQPFIVTVFKSRDA